MIIKSPVLKQGIFDCVLRKLSKILVDNIITKSYIKNIELGYKKKQNCMPGRLIKLFNKINK